MTWKAKLSADSMAPSDQQWLILDTIHERAKLEYEWERMEPNDSHAMANDQYKALRQAEPLFRLIHGLPGSGKSKVLKWLRSYLVEVWHMTEEEDFVFLAPMNSMAAGIGGSTLHSWAEIKWMNQQGQVIQPNRPNEGRDVPSLAVKNLKLRYLFVR